MPPNEAAWIDCTAVPSQTNPTAMSGRAVVIGKGLVIEVHFADSPHVAQGGPESTGSAQVISARSLTSIHIAGQDYGTYHATTYEDPGYVTLTFSVANAAVLLPAGTGPTDIGQMLDAIGPKRAGPDVPLPRPDISDRGSVSPVGDVHRVVDRLWTIQLRARLWPRGDSAAVSPH